jgi:SAM-dependent methyltransferase
MDERYWDGVALDYDQEIFDVLAHDRQNLIRTHIAQLGSQDKVAGDFGCGIGKFVPLLAAGFGQVHAVDISRGLLRRARDTWGHLPNVSFLRADLAALNGHVPRLDFVLCVNVLIMPSLLTRTRILATIRRRLQRGGHLVLVVPALESALLANFRFADWNVRNGMGHAAAMRAGFPAKPKTGPRLEHGLVPIEDVLTKHYLEEELEAVLGQSGFRIQQLTKIQYGWDTEFITPPRWMKEPYPWDWLLLAEKCA